LKDLLCSNEKDIHNLGLFCLFSISLYKLEIGHLRKLDAVTLLAKKLESTKYEKRVYALKIIINFMEISTLDESLLKEKNYELFNFLLYFTQSEIQEEQRLATRGLSKLPLYILEQRNPRIMPLPQEHKMVENLDSLSQNIAEDQEQKTIKEASSEASMSEKSSKSSNDSLDRNDKSVSQKSGNFMTAYKYRNWSKRRWNTKGY
jgi:hypothetical protein